MVSNYKIQFLNQFLFEVITDMYFSTFSRVSGSSSNSLNVFLMCVKYCLFCIVALVEPPIYPDSLQSEQKLRIHYLHQRSNSCCQETIGMVPLQNDSIHDQQRHNMKPIPHQLGLYLPLLKEHRHLQKE